MADRAAAQGAKAKRAGSPALPCVNFAPCRTGRLQLMGTLRAKSRPVNRESIRPRLPKRLEKPRLRMKARPVPFREEGTPAARITPGIAQTRADGSRMYCLGGRLRRIRGQARRGPRTRPPMLIARAAAKVPVQWSGDVGREGGRDSRRHGGRGAPCHGARGRALRWPVRVAGRRAGRSPRHGPDPPQRLRQGGPR